MKLTIKILSYFSCLLLSFPAVSSESIKSGPYFGVDVIQTNIQHRIQDIAYGTILPALEKDRTSEENQKYSFGLNVGYKIPLGNSYFIAPELFYDLIKSNARDFYWDDSAGLGTYPDNRLDINERFGVRMSAGYNLSSLASLLKLRGVTANQISKVSVFANAGISRVAYRIHLPNDGPGRTDESFEIAPIYGFGLNYALTEKWSAKLAYDVSKMNLRYLDNGMRDSVSIETFRLGVAYNF